jgi:hypothetical protein
MSRLAKRAIKACLGAENSFLLRRACGRIWLRFTDPTAANFLKAPFDVIFFCPWAVQWPKIRLVVEETIFRRNDWRVALVTTEAKEQFPDYINLQNKLAFISVPIESLFLFDTKIIYTPLPSWGERLPKARVVHSIFSINSLDGVFKKQEFDEFDYILCAGSHQLESFRASALRHPALLGKRLLPAGYPRLDLLLSSHSTERRQTDSSTNPTTVVYAPTHRFDVNEGLASLSDWGVSIINVLLAAGYRVIFRPHPASLFDQDRSLIDQICQCQKDNPKFSLDAKEDYTESYSSADLMVTDVSGTGFTFSFSFAKPSIFFAPNAEAERGLRGIQFDERHRIGSVVRDIDSLIKATTSLCERDMTDEIVRFRDEIVFNVGKSAAYIVNSLEDILCGRERPEWIRL